MENIGEIVIFRNENGEINVQIDAVNETIWATQKSMSELFGVQRPAITKHLAKIFADGELEEDSVSSILEHTAEDNKTYKVQFYNLDAIIAVGYRVKSTPPIIKLKNSQLSTFNIFVLLYNSNN